MSLPHPIIRPDAGRVLGAAVAIGVLAGGASALFLWLLALATATRESDTRIVWLLPLAGCAIGWLYDRYGRPEVRGVNIVVDRVQDGGTPIPHRMAPIVLVGTVLTHLFGGSAGREGTAVQMAASIADSTLHRLAVAPFWRSSLLRAGVAAGFAGAFGTPWAASLFALEFDERRLRPRAQGWPLILVAAHLSNATSSWLYHGHADYPTVPGMGWSPLLIVKWLAFAVAISFCIRLFFLIKNALSDALTYALPDALMWRMGAAGVLVVLLWQLTDGSMYLGLGVPTILQSFTDEMLPWYASGLKLVFTAVTLAGGYLGGEVTPMFFIGATLGQTLGPLLELPVALCAAVGLASMFGAAAGTPIALSIMAVELCGWAVFPHALLVAVVARYLRGNTSLYEAQRPEIGRAVLTETLTENSSESPPVMPASG